MFKNRTLMFEPKNVTGSDDSTSKMKKLISQRIWVASGEQMGGNWARNNRLSQPSSHPGSQIFLHAESSIERRAIHDDHREGFHHAMGLVLVTAQCFGIFPLVGVLSRSPKNLVFKKLSWRTTYAVMVIVMLFVIATIAVIHAVRTLGANSFLVSGEIEKATVGATFYGINFMVAVQFMLLTPRWVSLQREWRAVEEFIKRFLTAQDDITCTHRSFRLRWKFSMIAAVVVIVALVEHGLSTANSFSSSISSSTSNWTIEWLLRDHVENSHGFFFTVCNYNLGVGIFIFFINKIALVIWNLADVFIILNSLGLTESYSALNHRLIGDFPNEPKFVDWREIRQCYAKLSSLVKNVDKNISPIILLSFTNNLYFICLQLLNGLSPRKGTTLNKVYFFGSFAFVVGRAVAVTLLSARINDQSKLAITALYNCPGPVYNIEVQRLLQQLTTDEVCFTGLRLFSVTRSFLLAAASAILTYEVILLQFHIAARK